MLPGVYAPRPPAGTVLYQVVGMHLERFLAETAAATDGVGVPRFKGALPRGPVRYGTIRRPARPVRKARVWVEQRFALSPAAAS